MTPRTCLVGRRPGLKFAVIYAETVHYHLGYLATPLTRNTLGAVAVRKSVRKF